MSEELESIEQRIRDAVRDLQEWRRRQEQQAVERMSPEERRAKVRQWTRDLGRGGAAVIVAGLLAGARVVHEVSHHPLRIAAVAVMVTAAVMAIRPDLGEPEETPGADPGRLTAPQPEPTLPTATLTPTQSPTLPDEDEGIADVEADAEGAAGGLGEIPGEDDGTPEPEPTDGPSATPTEEPTRMGTPSPTPTLPPPTTPSPRPTPSSSPTPTPTPTSPDPACLIYVDIPPLLELCLLR